MSNLIEHAEYELRLAGLFDKDSDYNGELARAVMPLIAVFSSQGHSGHSAHAVIALFSKLASFKRLSELTDKPDEWHDVTEQSCGVPTWQNKRQSTCFSFDGGKTYYDIDDKIEGKNGVYGRPLYDSKRAADKSLMARVVEVNRKTKERMAEVAKMQAESYSGSYAGLVPSQNEEVEAPAPPDATGKPLKPIRRTVDEVVEILLHRLDEVADMNRTFPVRKVAEEILFEIDP